MEKKSCCAGSCYLKKQLKENEKKEESAPLNEKQRVEYLSDLFQVDYTFSIPAVSTDAIGFAMLWSYGQTKSFTGGIFHPPSYLG